MPAIQISAAMHFIKPSSLVLGAILLGGCIPSVNAYRSTTHAVILDYRRVSYNIQHPETRIAWIEAVDGKTVPARTWTLKLLPGLHHLRINCVYKRPGIDARSTVSLSLNLKKGEVYQLYPVTVERNDESVCRVKVQTLH